MIQAIALSIICLSLLIMAYRKPRWGFSLLLVLLLSVTASYFYSKGRIFTPSETLTLKQAELRQAHLASGYAGSTLLRAELHNLHPQHTLNEINIRSTLYDCTHPESPLVECTELSQVDNTLRVFVAARQHKTVMMSFNINGITAPQLLPRWTHTIIKVK